MKHFFSSKVRVVLVLAILIAAGLAAVSNLTGQSIPDFFVQNVLTPIRSGASALTAQAERLYQYMFRYEALEAENLTLQQELSQLRQKVMEADSVARENERLRALLELKKAHEDYELIDADIISRSSIDWNSAFTINRGSGAGIETGMCVITASGEVVGLVADVGSNYAVVKTVLDSTLEISATIASSGYSGIVQGGYVTGQGGLLRMEYLPSSAVIRNRDQVVTSGSTVYPKNLIVGYIVDAGFNDTGVSKFALLEPAVDIERLEQVFVLTAYHME